MKIEIKNVLFLFEKMTPSQQIYDIQSDMARHDEEGSGGFRDEEDDYEDHNIGGSGDGSGYGNYAFFYCAIELWK